jgi:hypothetical protein
MVGVLFVPLLLTSLRPPGVVVWTAGHAILVNSTSAVHAPRVSNCIDMCLPLPSVCVWVGVTLISAVNMACYRIPRLAINISSVLLTIVKWFQSGSLSTCLQQWG